MPDPLSVRMSGPLAVHRSTYFAFLLTRGYTPRSAIPLLQRFAQLDRWLEAQGRSAQSLDRHSCQAFCDARRARGHLRGVSLRGLEPAITFLEQEGIVARATLEPPSDPVHREVLDPYRRWLENERGMVPSVVRQRVKIARQLLVACVGELGVVEGLGADDVLGFVHEHTRRYAASSAATDLSSLRSFLLFGFLHALFEHDLRGALPGVASVRQRHLPRTLDAAQAQCLLDVCDPATRCGRRDRAVLLLMVRLGLRRGDIASLELEHIDWRAGELRVAGKNRREERLPLPDDVGRALAGWLRDGRPSGHGRHVFLTVRAPIVSLKSAAVTDLITAACRRAGLPRGSLPRLRHTAASLMLGAGASLDEIAQVLRHQSVETTALYAKIDDAALAELVLEWPEAER